MRLENASTEDEAPVDFKIKGELGERAWSDNNIISWPISHASGAGLDKGMRTKSSGS